MDRPAVQLGLRAAECLALESAASDMLGIAPDTVAFVVHRMIVVAAAVVVDLSSYCERRRAADPGRTTAADLGRMEVADPGRTKTADPGKTLTAGPE